MAFLLIISWTWGSINHSLPDFHALEHLRVGVEGQHGGAAHAGAVEQAKCQALHEGQRGGLGGAVVHRPGDG